MKRTKQRGLALISALILLAAIIIIAGVAIYVLLKLCKMMNGNGNGGGQTNGITQVDFPIVESYLGEEKPIVLPTLMFPEIGAVAGTSEADPFGVAHVEIERSTNLVNWEVIGIATNPQALLMDYDTNKPPERAYYRGKFVIP